MVDFISTLIALVVYCGLSWIVTAGIIKLITLCFGWPFSLLTATGIWLILALARSVFKPGPSGPAVMQPRRWGAPVTSPDRCRVRRRR